MATTKKRRQFWYWWVSLSDETEKTLVIGAYSVKQGWHLVYMAIRAPYGWTPRIVDTHRHKITRPINAPRKGAFVMHEGKLLKF